MSREGRMVGDLLATVRTGANELVRQNAYDLLLKLASDGLRAARQAIEVIERTNALVGSNDSSRSSTGG
jgi:hypothetical protein